MDMRQHAVKGLLFLSSRENGKSAVEVERAVDLRLGDFFLIAPEQSHANGQKPRMLARIGIHRHRNPRCGLRFLHPRRRLRRVRDQCSFLVTLRFLFLRFSLGKTSLQDLFGLAVLR